MLIEIIAIILLCLFIGISQSVGMGGGPIINVILTIGLGIQIKQSVHITYLFLFGASLATIVANINKKNPLTNGPIMNYNLIVMTLPMISSGSLIGSIVKNFISEFLLTIFLTSILIYLLIIMVLQWNTQIKNNKIKQSQLVQQVKDSQTNKVSSLIFQKDFSLQETQKAQIIINSSELQKILQRQKLVVQWDKLFSVFDMFVITFFCVMLRGKKDYFQSIIGINSCGFYGFLILFVHFSICLIYSILVYKRIQKIQLEKQKLGYKYKQESQQVHLTSYRRNMTIISGFLAGVLGASLGLGGGVILVPIWITSGINKIVATSSSSPLILVSASISISIELLCQNYKSVWFFIFYLIMSFFASFFVKDLITFLTNKYQIKNMIYILLVITICAALGTMVPFEFSKYLKNKQIFLEMGQFC